MNEERILEAANELAGMTEYEPGRISEEETFEDRKARIAIVLRKYFLTPRRKPQKGGK